MRKVELRIERETFALKGGEGELHAVSVKEGCAKTEERRPGRTAS
jgi:hypothetical protein